MEKIKMIMMMKFKSVIMIQIVRWGFTAVQKLIFVLKVVSKGAVEVDLLVENLTLVVKEYVLKQGMDAVLTKFLVHQELCVVDTVILV